VGVGNCHQMRQCNGWCYVFLDVGNYNQMMKCTNVRVCGSNSSNGGMCGGVMWVYVLGTFYEMVQCIVGDVVLCMCIAVINLSNVWWL
jgi:hypothetical protein